MNETTDASPLRRTPWKLWQALLLPVPGLIFTVSWAAFYYRHLSALAPGNPLLRPEDRWWRHSLEATLSSVGLSGMLGVFSFFIVACILAHSTRSRPGHPGTGAWLTGLLLIVVNLAVCFAGCSLGSKNALDLRPSFPSSPTIWRASTENGDKPGIGMEIRRAGHDPTCLVFLLDPNFPHDFSKGRQCPTAITFQSKDAMEFTVQWLPNLTESRHLFFPDGVQEEGFRAVFSVNSDEPGMEYNFQRLR